MVSVKLTDENGKHIATESADTMRQAMRIAANTADIYVSLNMARHVYIRDVLGGLRAEYWRDDSGNIQTRHTK